MKKILIKVQIFALLAVSVFTQGVITSVPQVEAAATPTCTFLTGGNPLATFLGETFQYGLQFDNTGADTGFSPMIETVLPAEVTFSNAVFSIGNLALPPFAPTPTTVVDNDGGSPATGTVTNPITGTITTLPVGTHYIVFRLPLGSFTPGQEVVSININASLSNLVTPGVNLGQPMQGRCGFILGNDALDNPTTDPPIFGPFITNQILPTVLIVNKALVTTDGEGETATGENFPVTYTISGNVANTAVIAPLTLEETIPTNLKLSTVTTVADQGNGFLITFTPLVGPAQTSASVPFTPSGVFPSGGTIAVQLNSITGTTAGVDGSFVWQGFVPELDSTSTAVLDPTSGATVNIPNTADGNGTYLGGPVSDTSDPITLAARSIATQKGASIFTNTGDPGFSPGDVIQFTLDYQVSDFFGFNNVVLEDVLPDGLLYTPGSAQVSVTEDGSTSGPVGFSEATITSEANVVSGPAPYNFSGPECLGCTLAITRDSTNDNDAIVPPGDGDTVLAFDLSTVIDAISGRDDTLTGGQIGPTPPGEPTRGTLTFLAQIQESFVDSQTFDTSVDATDDMANSETISGQITSPPSPGTFVTDGSGATITIVAPTFAKAVIGYKTPLGALDVAPFAQPSPLHIAPGDTITFSLTINVPTGDLEDLSIRDYLPIPFLDATEITTFDAATITTQYNPTDGVTSSVPAAGFVGFGNNTTGYPGTLPTPTITVNPTENRFIVDFPDNISFEETPSDGMVIELLFTVTASNEQFADSLSLVNVAVFSINNSNTANASVADAMVDMVTSAPHVSVSKGIISTNHPGAIFTPPIVGPVVFAAPGTNPPFTGPFSSTDLQTNPIDSDLSQVDAGDKVRFALVLENDGTASAYDFNFTDTLPVGFTSPTSVADLNLQVFNANGDDLSASTTGGFFGRNVLGGTSAGGDTAITLSTVPPLSATAPYFTTEGLANEGENILVVTYELRIDPSVEPLQELENLGQLTQYRAVPGGGNPNYVSDISLYEDETITTISDVILAKSAIVAPVGDQTYTTLPNSTIGEVTRYRVRVTVPEGTIPDITLNDNIPAGLGYYIDNGVSLDGSVACTGTAFSGTLPAITVASPTGSGVAASGANLTVNFDADVVATDDNNLSNNTFCILYDVVTLDVPGNNGLPAGTTSLTNSATLTYGTTPHNKGPVTATITVVEPRVRVTKAVSPGSGDAGDILTYTLTLDHHPTSSSDAFDLTLTDTVNAKLAVQDFATDGVDNDGDGTIDEGDEITASYLSGATLTWNSANTSNALFSQLPLASSIVLRFKVLVLNTVSPSEVIANNGAVTFDNIPGTPVSPLFQRAGNRTGSVDFSVLNISAAKNVNNTSEAHTGISKFNVANADLAIGEEVTYYISMQVPEGTTTALTIRDDLPNIFRLDSATVIQDDTGSPAPTIVLSDAANADGIDDRATVTFASVVNPPDADTEFIVIAVQATVMNNGGNANGQNKTNTATVTFTGQVGGAIVSTANVDIVEPQLVVQKSIDTPSGDAGDIRTFTINAHHSVSSAADAFDLVLDDTVPAGLTVVGDFDTDGLDNDGDGLIDGADTDELAGGAAPFFNGLSTFTWNTTTTNNTKFDQLTQSPADSIILQFKVQVDTGVFPGQIITNQADLDYDSLPANSDPNERSYSTNGTAALTIVQITASKSLFSTNVTQTSSGQFNGTLSDLAIGEQVTYRISVPIPESVFTNFTITDEIPEFLSGGRFRVDSGSLVQDDGVIHSNPPTITISDSLGADGIDDTIVFDFGTITNAPDLDTETIIVSVVATVIDNPGNVAGTGYTNTALVNFTENTGPVITDSLDVDVVEPSLSFTKTVAPLTGDSGDPIVYTITVTNTGTAPAFDLNMTDVVPTNVTVDSAFDTDGLDNDGDNIVDNETPAFAFFSGPSNFTWNFATTGVSNFVQLDPVGSFTLQYRATIDIAVTGNDVLTNNAQLTFNSTPGTNPDERSYNRSSDASVTVPFSNQLLKTLRDPDTTKSIGETIPYRVVVTLLEGTTNPVTVDDTLPAGLALIPGSLVVTNSNPGEVTFTGTPTAPTIIPPSATITAGNTQSLSFDFGQVVNSNVDNNIAETFTIDYDVVVLNSTDNNNGNSKLNSVTALFGATTVGPLSAPAVTVVEPDMIIIKDSNPVYVSGDIVTYQVRLENNGTATAHDVDITDTLPSGVTYIGNEILINGPGMPTINTGGLPTIIYSFPQISTAFDSSNPVIFTFQVSIDESTPVATTLTNSALLEYTSIAGSPALIIPGNDLSSERTGDNADPGGNVNDYNMLDTYDILVTRPDLSTSNKSVTDLNGGDVEPIDVLRYRIDIINTGNFAASGIHVFDNIPANVNNFTIVTLPSSGINNSLPGPAGANGTGLLDFTNISLTSSGPGSSTFIEFDVTVDGNLAPDTPIQNCMTVEAAIEGGPDQPSSCVQVIVKSPLLTIEKTVESPSYRIGGQVPYTIVVTNNGNANATTVTLVDTMPAELTYLFSTIQLDTVAMTDTVDIDAADFNVSNPNAVTVVVPVLPPAGSFTVKFQATINSDTLNGTIITNTATVTDDQEENLSDSVDITAVFVGSSARSHPKTSNPCGQTSFPDRDPCLELNPDRPVQFSDVKNTDDAYPYIVTLKNSRIKTSGDYVFSGTGNNSTGKQQAKFQEGTWEFQPKRLVNRLEAVKTILVTNCIPILDAIPVPSNGFHFTDLPTDIPPSNEEQYFIARVMYTGYNAGVVQGYEDGSARPANLVSTLELTAMGLRAAKVIPEGYEISHAPWYARFTEFAKANGIYDGITLALDDHVPRADFAKIIVKIMATSPDPGIYGYIQRVDMAKQTYAKNTVFKLKRPSWDFNMFDVAPDCGRIAGSCLLNDPGREVKFSDENKDFWAYPYIEILRTTKIIDIGDYIASGHGNDSTGRQEDKFRSGVWEYQPERLTNRFELLKMALVSNCISVEDTIPKPESGFEFVDVSVDTPATDEKNYFIARVVYTAYKYGMVLGYEDHTVRPLSSVTRYEANAILSRIALDIDPKSTFKLPYIDTVNDAWYSQWLAASTDAGIVSGYNDNTFRGNDHLLRSEMAKMIVGFMEHNRDPGIAQYGREISDAYKI